MGALGQIYYTFICMDDQKVFHALYLLFCFSFLLYYFWPF